MILSFPACILAVARDICVSFLPHLRFLFEHPIFAFSFRMPVGALHVKTYESPVATAGAPHVVHESTTLLQMQGSSFTSTFSFDLNVPIACLLPLLTTLLYSNLCLLIRVFTLSAFRLRLVAGGANHEYQEVLLSSCTVRKVNHETARETSLHCCAGQHLCLQTLPQSDHTFLLCVGPNNNSLHDSAKDMTNLLCILWIYL